MTMLSHSIYPYTPLFYLQKSTWQHTILRKQSMQSHNPPITTFFKSHPHYFFFLLKPKIHCLNLCPNTHKKIKMASTTMAAASTVMGLGTSTLSSPNKLNLSSGTHFDLLSLIPFFLKKIMFNLYAFLISFFFF